MVSYYNTLPYSQKHSANVPYPPSQSWFSSNYHPHPNQPYLSDVEPPPHHAHHMYYNPHVFHQSSPDWAAHDNFQAQQSPLLQPSHGAGTGLHLNQNLSSNSDNLAEGLPSPPITVSGSEMSSPGVPNGSTSPQTGSNNRNNNNNTNNNNITNRPTPVKSPYYDWMKKPSYPTQPNPGKTRTKDKYRVVYTDFQRLELEKEYHTSRYITIRRKTELAQSLQLSERQVKIWFQNRRAKERKQTKKREDPLNGSVITSQHSSAGIPNMIETKPKIEPGLHLQHPLHQMSSMAMGMPPMGLHHSVLHHGHMMGVPPPPPPQHLQQAHHQAIVSTGSLSM